MMREIGTPHLLTCSMGFDEPRFDESRYAGTSHGGKTGIESSYEFELHGYSGYRHMVTTARGRQLSTDTSDVLDTLPSDQPPGPGDNVYTTLDLDLQGERPGLLPDDSWKKAMSSSALCF